MWAMNVMVKLAQSNNQSLHVLFDIWKFNLNIGKALNHEGDWSFKAFRIELNEDSQNGLLGCIGIQLKILIKIRLG